MGILAEFRMKMIYIDYYFYFDDNANNYLFVV